MTRVSNLPRGIGAATCIGCRKKAPYYETRDNGLPGPPGHTLSCTWSARIRRFVAKLSTQRYADDPKFDMFRNK